MNPLIFRKYDIRGRTPEELNQKTVYQLELVLETTY